MSLEEAIEIVSRRPKNENLHWFICKWNDGFIIHSSSHIKRFPNTEYLYTTDEKIKARNKIHKISKNS